MMEPGETKEIRVILIGKTGAGKSYLGNALLGREEFELSVFAESETTKCAFGKQEITSKSRKYILKVIDTPGLMDTRLPEEETRGELVKCIALALPGPHLFVIVVPIGRFTKEEFEVVEMLKREFGDELMDFALVVFSHGSQLRNMSIEDYLERAPANLKQIVKESHNRYAVIGDDRDENFQKSVQDITDLIADQHQSGYYTNEMFKMAEENKKMIIASLEEDKNKTIKKLEEDVTNLGEENCGEEKCDEEERKRKQEEKLRKEAKLKKIKASSSAEAFDDLLVTGKNIGIGILAGICICGCIITLGVGGVILIYPMINKVSFSCVAGGITLLTAGSKTKKD